MYLPSLNELNKNAVQQKIIDQGDERVQRNALPTRSSVSTNYKSNSDSVSPQGNSKKISLNPSTPQEESILLGSKYKENSMTSVGAGGPRRDRLGNLIRIGEKQHKLTFRDQIEKGEKVAQIYEVECWKQYNTPTDLDESAFSCKCNIF